MLEGSLTLLLKVLRIVRKAKYTIKVTFHSGTRAHEVYKMCFLHKNDKVSTTGNSQFTVGEIVIFLLLVFEILCSCCNH